jgi:uncharacterized membrane protein YbaN (DUF454 family)
MAEPIPDLLRPRPPEPTWRAVLFIAGAIVCFALGVIGWLIPIMSGLPFYALGLILLGLVSDRMRRLVNSLERRLPESVRRRARGMIARRAGHRLRHIVHLPDEA